MRREVRFFCSLFLVAAASAQQPQALSGTARTLSFPGGSIDVSFGEGNFDLPPERLAAWITRAATAVATYYGTFPVPRMRLRINPSERRTGVFGGTTWGSHPPFTRISVGVHTTEQQLANDWMLTHELVHTAFPDVDEDQHWIEEGVATYVEPIARVQTGELTPEKIWGDMARDMHQGQPGPGDSGLDHTHTWGRTYWGGALFCFVADVHIHKETGNRHGLQDALRAIRAAGGTIEADWSLERALEIGDQATGTRVLSTLYSEMKDKAVHVDLDSMWRDLGVRLTGGAVSLDDTAPLAALRRSITTPQKKITDPKEHKTP
jgi:hypothetical protein